MRMRGIELANRRLSPSARDVMAVNVPYKAPRVSRRLGGE